MGNSVNNYREEVIVVGYMFQPMEMQGGCLAYGMQIWGAFPFLSLDVVFQEYV